jgi:hypothetical protein
MNVTICLSRDIAENHFTVKAESIKIADQSKIISIVGNEVLNTPTSINEMVIPFENTFALSFFKDEVIIVVDHNYFNRLKSIKNVFNQ